LAGSRLASVDVELADMHRDAAARVSARLRAFVVDVAGVEKEAA
jgi:hypothetical protein